MHSGGVTGIVSTRLRRFAGVLTVSIVKLSDPNAHEYLTEQVARGAEDYYAGRGEAPGYWLGGGAEVLGLSGGVDHGDFAKVLQAVDPATGEKLSARADLRKVVGWDHTFSVSKGVSVLWAAGDGELRSRIEQAHRESIADAIGLAEDEYVRGRRGAGGHTQVDTTGLVAAAFQHRTSREGDPHLHTHVVWANQVQDRTDGSWGTLDGREPLRWKDTLSRVYDSGMRARLHEFGVETEIRESRTYETMAVPDDVLDAMSKRSAQVREELGGRGIAPGDATHKEQQIAALATRREKDLTGVEGDLFAHWQAEITGHGFTLDDIAHAVSSERTEELDDERARIAEKVAGPDGITAHAATFTRRELLAEWAVAAPKGMRADQVRAQADLWWHSNETIALEPHEISTARTDDRDGWHHLKDGHIVAAEAEQIRTTPEMLDVEERAVTATDRLAHTGSGSLSDPKGANREHLSAEQRGAVDAMCSDRGLVVVTGPAGAGKTTILQAAAAQWETEGRTVIGAAPKNVNAETMQVEAGLDATSLAKLRRDLEHGRRHFDESTTIVVDEAFSAASRDLAPVLDAAADAKGQVVMLGDPHQTQAVAAGGVPLAVIDEGLPDGARIDLRTVHRQHDKSEIAVLADLRNGDSGKWLGFARDHGRVHAETTTIEDTRAAAVEGWAVDWQRYQDTPPDRRDAARPPLMISARNADVDALNQGAQQGRIDRGELDPADALRVGGRRYIAGDRVIAVTNDRDRSGLLNGHAGTIAAINHEQGTITVDIDAKTRTGSPTTRTHLLDIDQSAEVLRLGYAATVHKAHGQTVDSAHIHADHGLNREDAYTAFSRARGHTHTYLTREHSDIDPTEHLGERIAHSRPEHAAITHERHQAVAERSWLQHVITEQRTRDHEHGRSRSRYTNGPSRDDDFGLSL